MAEVLEALIIASERAACIARACCTDSTRDSLVVAAKAEGEANARFDKDFKTIADVLAQEAAKTEIATRIPDLTYKVRGEECSEIGGVNIAVQDSEERTGELLNYLLPPNAAKSLAEAAHCKIDLELEDVPKEIPEVNVADLGVWIDPIDATAEFIAGVQGRADAESGLPCVTVLVGAYSTSTGEPLMGVINQPFYNNGKGRLIWGVSYKDINQWGGSDLNSESEPNTILMSSAEGPEIADKIRDLGWDVKSMPGAGHKLMKLVLGEASAYILSKGTTFRWDTCAPHAVLKAKGGDILHYGTKQPLTYNDPDGAKTKDYCNEGGIIAFADNTVLEKLEKIFD